MWWCDVRRFGAIPGPQDRGDRVQIDLALPHRDERAGERSHHLVQEGVGPESELEPVVTATQSLEAIRRDAIDGSAIFAVTRSAVSRAVNSRSSRRYVKPDARAASPGSTSSWSLRLTSEFTVPSSVWRRSTVRSIA